MKKKKPYYSTVSMFNKRFCITVAIVLTPLWIVLLLRGMGFYVDETGWYVGEIAAEKNDVRICQKIIMTPWEQIFSSTQDQRDNCVYTFAEITQDPTACESLLPSEYGISCINETITRVYEKDPHSGFFPISECNKIQKKELAQDWCNLLNAHKSHDTSDCKSIINLVLKKACIEKFNAWRKYPELRNSSYFGDQS